MKTIMKFTDVSKSYKDGSDTIEALKPTNFEIKEGELVAIIGPSGSGKSTLLTLMGGLQQPSKGQVSFLGQDIGQMSQKERNRLRFDKIGFILQASNLVPFLTVEEQFKLVDKYGRKHYDADRAKKLMDELGIYKRKDNYPGDLSGGERQRAAICRAIYAGPQLLLADEPTASLDTEKAMTVAKILKELTHRTNRSTVMVTHDERLLSYCDRVFRITDGRLSEVTEEKLADQAVPPVESE